MSLISPDHALSPRCPQYNWEDLLQEATIRLYQAIKAGKLRLLDQFPCSKAAFVSPAKGQMRWLRDRWWRDLKHRERIWNERDGVRRSQEALHRVHDPVREITVRDECQVVLQRVYDALPILYMRMPAATEAFVLHVFYDCRQGEIAAYQEVTREAVNRRIKRAREELKRLVPRSEK